jgi:26 proteasome complex subunit DSS1
MSAAPASGAAPTAKATSTEATTTPPKDVKPAAALEEDDEFEDFPVEGTVLTVIPGRCFGEAEE